MPVVTAIFPEIKSASEPVLNQFVSSIASICEKCLNAEPGKVQIQILSALSPIHGRGAYIEIRYRASIHRNEKVMADFMEQIDEVTHATLGIPAPRIRCYPQENSKLYSRN